MLKLITIFNKEANTIEEVLLEELQVFKVNNSNEDERYIWFIMCISINGEIYNPFVS